MANDARKAYPEFDQQKNIWYTGKCIDGTRLEGEPVDWEEVWNKYVDEDQDRSWNVPGLEITMEEGPEGNSMKIVITMGATKLGASALALAAMASLY